MADEGVRDYRKAKRKACSRLGVSIHRSVPTNLEVEVALEDQLALFASDEIEARQRCYLETALVVMDLLADCRPKLTGAALTGTITSSRPVELHVFPPTFEQVCMVLDEAGLHYDQIEKRKRFCGKRFENIPGFETTALDVDVEILCFLPGAPYPPLSSTNGKSVQSISRKKVRRLLS